MRWCQYDACLLFRGVARVSTNCFNNCTDPKKQQGFVNSVNKTQAFILTSGRVPAIKRSFPLGPKNRAHVYLDSYTTVTDCVRNAIC